MMRRNKKATVNASQMNMVQTSSNVTACRSQCDARSPVLSASDSTTLDIGVVETVFIKEERVWDDYASEVHVKDNSEEYGTSEVLLKGGEKDCVLKEEVPVKEEIKWDGALSQEVPVKVESVFDSGGDGKSLPITEENIECLNTCAVTVEGVRVKEEDKNEKGYIKVVIGDEYEVPVKEEARSPGAAGADHKAKCEVVLGPEGPQPQDIVFAMRDSTLALNRDAGRFTPELSHHAKELLEPTCSLTLKPDGTEPAFDKMPSVIRARPTLTRRARTEKTTCTCDYCGKQFVKKPNLVAHIRIHMGIKRYLCSICNKAYTSLYNLTRHKLIHTGVKPYSCELCEKRFTDPCNLVIHRRTHKERETFSCKICNKQFKQNHSLKSHRRVHTGDKPFTCEICKRSFSNPSNLKRHHRVHTGEKPHECKFCKKRYVDLRDLTRHEHKHIQSLTRLIPIMNKKQE